MSLSPTRELRRDALFDILVANPQGLDVDDMCDELALSYPQVKTAISDLRLFLGDVDSINLPCDPTPNCGRWLYRLVGTLDDVRPWVTNRIGDSESRIRTMTAMLSSIVSATDGRSIQGRKARIMERQLRRLVEDLDAMVPDPATP